MEKARQIKEGFLMDIKIFDTGRKTKLIRDILRLLDASVVTHQKE